MAVFVTLTNASPSSVSPTSLKLVLAQLASSYPHMRNQWRLGLGGCLSKYHHHAVVHVSHITARVQEKRVATKSHTTPMSGIASSAPATVAIFKDTRLHGNLSNRALILVNLTMDTNRHFMSGVIDVSFSLSPASSLSMPSCSSLLPSLFTLISYLLIFFFSYALFFVPRNWVDTVVVNCEVFKSVCNGDANLCLSRSYMMPRGNICSICRIELRIYTSYEIQRSVK